MAVLFSIAFGYIEAAVVVYLRTIFHPEGFTFPLTVFEDALTAPARRLLFTEIAREAATLVLIVTAARLFRRAPQQTAAYFLIIFAVWDLSYYLWLKVILNWPASIMDWDILFLMPVTWAAPVLAPVLVSFAMLAFAVVILYRSAYKNPVRVTRLDWIGFFFACLSVVASFCIAGRHISQPDYRSGFYWPLFAFGYLVATTLFIKCLARSNKPAPICA